MTAREVLDGIKTRLAAAHIPCEDCGKCRTVPDEDWCGRCEYRSCERGPDCTDVAVDTARLTRAVEDVLAVHQPIMVDGEPDDCLACDWGMPDYNGWPCPTVAAIENALNPKEGR